jgi:GLPGLI family protein
MMKKNMKILINILIGCFIYNGSLAQVRDTSLLEAIYEFKYAIDSLHSEIKNNDILVVEIGAKASYCYSLYNKKKQEIIVQDILRQSAISEKIEIDGNNFNLPNGMLQVLYKIPNQNTTFVLDNVYGFKCYYTDSLHAFNWKILQDTLTILDYLCQKATTEYRGRSYIAWFTPALPYNNGPLKFGGLPGLIMKLEDTKNNFVFLCTAVQKPKEQSLVNFDIKGYMKYSRRDIIDLHKKADEDPIGFANTINPNFHANVNPSNQKRQKKIYNPIELE